MSVLVQPERLRDWDGEKVFRWVQQTVGRDLGQTDWGSPIDHVSYTSNSRYAHVLDNLGTGGHLNVRDEMQVKSDGTGTVIRALTISDDLTVNDDFTVLGDTVLGNNAAVDTTTLTSILTASGAATFSSTLTANGAATFNAAVTLGDAAADALTVNATSTFASPATFNGTMSTTAATNLGNGDADAITVIGVSTFKNAAGSATQAFVDAANDRVIIGSATALSTATNDKFSVIGGRAYVSPNSESLALGLRYGAAVLGQVFLGASNSATPDLILSNAGGTQIGRFTTAGLFLTGTQTTAIGTAGLGDVQCEDLWLVQDASNYRRILANGSNLQITQNAGTGVHLTMDTNGLVTIKGMVIDTNGANITGGVTVVTGGIAVTAGAIKSNVVSGTPAANTLYTDNTPKGWVMGDTAGNVSASFNVTSITDNGTGDWSVNWDRDMASATYAAVASGKSDGAISTEIGNTSFAAGVTRVRCWLISTALAVDPNHFFCMAMGLQ